MFNVLLVLRIFMQERKKRGESNNQIFLADIFAYQVLKAWMHADIHTSMHTVMLYSY